MKALKPILCVLMILLILWLSVPAGAASIPDGMEGPKDTAQLAERIYKLMEEYPSGSYFSKNGRSCVSHAKSISNCIEVTAEQAGTPGNRQCYGFARMVFWHVFGKPFPHFNDASSWLVTESDQEAENVTKIWSAVPGTKMDEAAVREAFSNAMPGDFVQCGIPHSMTFLQMEDTGILVYDANFEMSTCRVLVHVVDWDRLIKWIRRYGMSYYRAVNYPETVNHEPFEYSDFNGGDVANLKITAHPAAETVLFHDPDLTGLALTYTKGSLTYDVTCTGKDTFHVVGGGKDLTVEAGGEQEFSPVFTPTPAEGNLAGSVRIEFLDTAATLIVPVEKRDPVLLSFTCPSDCSYRLGETFDPSGARMEVQDEFLNTLEFKDGEITFSGLDLETPGEYQVTMEPYGLTSPPFPVTVIRGVSTTAPAETDPPVTGWTRIVIAALILTAAAAVGFIALRSTRRSRKERR